MSIYNRAFSYKSVSSMSNHGNENILMKVESAQGLTTSARSNYELTNQLPSSYHFSRNVSKFNSMKMQNRTTERDIEMDDGENYRVRQFNTTKKGTIINRGDSFKTSFRHRSIRVRSLKSGSISSSNSLSKIDKNSFLKKELDNLVFEQNELIENDKSDDNIFMNNTQNPRNCISNPKLYSITSTNDTVDTLESYYVYVFGATGVGKSGLIKQFETSEYRGIYEIKHGQLSDRDESEPISIMLDGVESQIFFKAVDIDLVKLDMKLVERDNCWDNDGYIVCYSVTDRSSFEIAISILNNLVHFEKTELPIILVGNKSDLVRKKSINRDEARKIARKYGCKFVETSVAINDKIDDLLAGILKQIRINKRKVINDIKISTENIQSEQEKLNKVNNTSKKCDEMLNDFKITDLTAVRKQPIAKTKHLSLMSGNESFFKKLFNTVFKKKSDKHGGIDSVENLFSPVPTAPCEAVLSD